MTAHQVHVLMAADDHAPMLACTIDVDCDLPGMPQIADGVRAWVSRAERRGEFRREVQALIDGEL